VDATFLKQVPLFQGLSDDEIRSIAAHAVMRKVSKNTVLLREGEQPVSLYVVQRGKVHVSVSGEDGRELVLSILGPNELFGELALIDGEPRSATVIATDDSEIAVVSRSDFADCLRKNPDIAIKLLKGLALRVRELNDNVKGFAMLDVQGRVTRLLERLARNRDGRLVTDPITQQEIANMVGASREMVSRIINQLRADGAIEVKGRAITVNRDALPRP
jgi:CRP/FNR family cyclic AMP-dependent transcriptional regulator